MWRAPRKPARSASSALRCRSGACDAGERRPSTVRRAGAEGLLAARASAAPAADASSPSSRPSAALLHVAHLIQIKHT